MTITQDMKKIFRDILKTSGVRGVVIFSQEGRVAFKEVSDEDQQKPDFDAVLYQFVETLERIHEIEVAFEHQKVYARRTDIGFLLILMDLSAPMAMIRLNCDMVMPDLKTVSRPKGLARFFKKR